MTYEDLHDVRKHSFSYKAEGHWPSQDRQTDRTKPRSTRKWHIAVLMVTKVLRHMALFV